MGLLVDIARCPNVAHCLSTATTTHPCAKVVHSQDAGSVGEFQSPEPWSGNIRSAPILFVSSNPSIEPTGYAQYPRAPWHEGDIEDYFENRFGGSRLSSIVDGVYGSLPLGTKSSRPVAFWTSVRARTAELLEKRRSDVSGGRDFCLTEVVRCKSIAEAGVPEALSTCAGLYLGPTLRLSAARTIVCVGKQSAKAMRSHYSLNESTIFDGPLFIEGRSRYVIFLPHPNARSVPKSLTGWLNHHELTTLQAWTQGKIQHDDGQERESPS